MIMAVCTDKNWAIGYNNELIYRIKEDMQRFKALTWNKTVIMGRKTFQSIGKPLPSRTNIVITNDYIEMNKLYKDFEDEFNTQIRFMSMDMLIKNIEELPVVYDKNAYLIGGASLYNRLMPYVDKIELTFVHPFEKIYFYKNGTEKRCVEEPEADAFLKGFEFNSKEGREIEYELGAPRIDTISGVTYHNISKDGIHCMIFKVIHIRSGDDHYEHPGQKIEYDFITLQKERELNS